VADIAGADRVVWVLCNTPLTAHNSAVCLLK
jgi:hypothetical protein